MTQNRRSAYNSAHKRGHVHGEGYGRIPADEIRTIGRNARGVKIMNIAPGDKVTGVAKLVTVPEEVSAEELAAAGTVPAGAPEVPAAEIPAGTAPETDAENAEPKDGE